MLHQKSIFYKGVKGKDTTEDFPHTLLVKQHNCFWEVTEPYSMVWVER